MGKVSDQQGDICIEVPIVGVVPHVIRYTVEDPTNGICEGSNVVLPGPWLNPLSPAVLDLLEDL